MRFIQCFIVLLAQPLYIATSTVFDLAHGFARLDLPVQPRHSGIAARQISVTHSSTPASTTWTRTSTPFPWPVAPSDSIRSVYVGAHGHATYPTSVSIDGTTFDSYTQSPTFPAELSSDGSNVSTTTTSIWTSSTCASTDDSTEISDYAFASTDSISDQNGVPTTTP